MIVPSHIDAGSGIICANLVVVKGLTTLPGRANVGAFPTIRRHRQGAMGMRLLKERAMRNRVSISLALRAFVLGAVVAGAGRTGD